ncbi:unnamed protein product [Cylicocyclus nassatus]|uniref:Uncharacterized protein n=1 Tax=Cylicocyclus nassatus TaxID=53992 RepID=A0AA36GIQ6_CYLNA|nr:unnamed protein product [Cylicocyclus nassatus]
MKNLEGHLLKMESLHTGTLVSFEVLRQKLIVVKCTVVVSLHLKKDEDDPSQSKKLRQFSCDKSMKKYVVDDM